MPSADLGKPIPPSSRHPRHRLPHRRPDRSQARHRENRAHPRASRRLFCAPTRGGTGTAHRTTSCCRLECAPRRPPLQSHCLVDTSHRSVQKYNPATANSQQDMATFVAQIGTKGMCDGTQTTDNPFSSCGETNSNNTSQSLLNEPPDMAVDPLPDPVTGTPGTVYIADGYGNHRTSYTRLPTEERPTLTIVNGARRA